MALPTIGPLKVTARIPAGPSLPRSIFMPARCAISVMIPLGIKMFCKRFCGRSTVSCALLTPEACNAETKALSLLPMPIMGFMPMPIMGLPI
eukprot:CAMPEP_0180782648 /NCGR_PEP_ID=MMETSP1038_2-20121128/48495_1 /TAXON_ID=632150 /ORGANISM="Azadinium spinosum, Strain 3D9" /LENGTH=91 /DNA_ID=CAMNT_0022818949 /DNA_START=35 /DNA_END=307 /DNA_ORIENTATION=+